MRRISLALQGGGAHGAFTWGVLDRLLDAEDIEVAAISGTSAGALNGAAFKAGMAVGGREGARAALRALWSRVAGVGDWRAVGWFRSALPPAAWWVEASEAAMPVSPADVAGLAFSPYDWPLWQNPLAPVVDGFRMDEVCANEGPRLFVSATNVHTGKLRVFAGAEVTREAILASACLPTLFRAVEIDGQGYWDGGYAANPALHPLYAPDLPDDLVIVSINPLFRLEIPRSAADIRNRLNEISFNAALLRDLRAIGFVKRLIAQGAVKKGAMKDVLVHMIADDDLMRGLSVRSKLSASPVLLDQLFHAGRAAAERFLTQDGQALGLRSSVDLAAMVD